MKLGPPQTPPIPESEPILTFEEFSHYDNGHEYNNFLLYFSSGMFGDIYRTKKHYKRFALENPDMAASLCDKIQNQRDKSKSSHESIEPFERDMYEAYKKMRGYGVSDEDLFS